MRRRSITLDGRFINFCDALYHCFCGTALLDCIGVLSYVKQLVTGARHGGRQEGMKLIGELGCFMPGLCPVGENVGSGRECVCAEQKHSLNKNTA